jgi:hypothetical protein
VIDPERIKELDEIRQREMAKEEARLKAKIADLQQDHSAVFPKIVIQNT